MEASAVELMGRVTFGDIIGKLSGALQVSCEGHVDDVVAVDGPALSRHAGFEVETALPRVARHTETRGILPVGARVIIRASRDDGKRDWSTPALTERRGPEAVEARLVLTAPPAARGSGHADLSDGAAKSWGIASGNCGLPVPLLTIAGAQVAAHFALQPLVNALRASTVTGKGRESGKGTFQCLRFTITAMVPALGVPDPYGPSLPEKLPERATSPELRCPWISDDKVEVVLDSQPQEVEDVRNQTLSNTELLFCPVDPLAGDRVGGA